MGAGVGVVVGVGVGVGVDAFMGVSVQLCSCELWWWSSIFKVSLHAARNLKLIIIFLLYNLCKICLVYLITSFLPYYLMWGRLSDLLLCSCYVSNSIPTHLITK